MLQVLLPGWAVGSGDHPGVAAGETTSFALEFAPVAALQRVRAPAPHRTALEAVSMDRYRVTGHVTTATQRITVVDVGAVGAFARHRVECPDGHLEAGDWFTGEILLAVDPFMYRTFHAAAAGEADITRRWTISSILMQVDGAGPWSPVDATGTNDSVLYMLSIRPAGW